MHFTFYMLCIVVMITVWIKSSCKHWRILFMNCLCSSSEIFTYPPFPPPYIFEKLIHPATSPDAFNFQTKMYSPYHAENEIYIIFMHQIIIRWSVLFCRLGRNQISFVGVYFVQVFEKTNCQNKMNQWSLSWYSRGFLSGWHWHQKRSGACILLFSPPKQHAKVGVPFPPSLKLIYYQLVLCSYLYLLIWGSCEHFMNSH